MRRIAIAVGLTCVLACQVSRANEVYWVPASDLAPEGWAGLVAAGDLDADGDYDLTMFGWYPPHHYWNIGTPASPEWSLDVTQYAGVTTCAGRAGALGDLDDDGDLDLVVSCLDGLLRFYRNIGTPQVALWDYEPAMFEGVEVPEGPGEPYLADLDADSDLDLLWADDYSQVHLIENVGTPASPLWHDWNAIFQFQPPHSNLSIAAGDLDGDGDLDIVGITWGSPTQCMENIGTPESYEFVQDPAMLTGIIEPGSGYGIELFDVDGDGDPDLIIGGESGNYLYLNESVTSTEPSTWGHVKSLYR
jgi:hypothetical protein